MKEKMVLADYHEIRRTRQLDGMLGLWRNIREVRKTKTEQRFAVYNADLIDEEGHHQVACVDGEPVVGMQSQADPEYIEYEILLAKTAHIDGFMVEFGWKGDRSLPVLNAMVELGKKYNFKVGVNWCDNFFFRGERSHDVELFTESLQFLLDELFSEPTAVVYDGRPLIFLFGKSFDIEAFRKVRAHNFRLPAGLGNPLIFRRLFPALIFSPPNGQIELKLTAEEREWESVIDGRFAWAPPRLRNGGPGTLYPDTDVFATQEDSIKYLEWMRENVRNRSNVIPPVIFSACPGKDSHGAGGWGHKYSYIPRENGETYRKMWEYNIKNRDTVDIVFIPSWNDFCEGTHIAPVQKNQYRDIMITEEMAARFKNISSSQEGILLPEQLFHLRKKARFLKNCGIDITSATESLDKCGIAISRAEYTEAALLIKKAKTVLGEFEKGITEERIVVSFPSEQVKPALEPEKENDAFKVTEEKGLYLRLSDEMVAKLGAQYYKGFMTFEYLNDNPEDINARKWDDFTVQTETIKRNKTDYPSFRFQVKFSEVCAIKKTSSGEWTSAKVEIFRENAVFRHGSKHNSDIYIEGDVLIKNIGFEFILYSGDTL